MVWSRVADSELLHKQNHWNCLQIPANGFCILWLLAALIRTKNLMLIDGIMGGLHLQRSSSFSPRHFHVRNIRCIHLACCFCLGLLFWGLLLLYSELKFEHCRPGTWKTSFLKGQRTSVDQKVPRFLVLYIVHTFLGLFDARDDLRHLPESTISSWLGLPLNLFVSFSMPNIWVEGQDWSKTPNMKIRKSFWRMLYGISIHRCEWSPTDPYFCRPALSSYDIFSFSSLWIVSIHKKTGVEVHWELHLKQAGNWTPWSMPIYA